MKRETAAALREFIRNDPQGFVSALINTIDTHAELPAEERGGRFQEGREDWALDFLLAHDNGEISNLEED